MCEFEGVSHFNPHSPLFHRKCLSDWFSVSASAFDKPFGHIVALDELFPLVHFQETWREYARMSLLFVILSYFIPPLAVHVTDSVDKNFTTPRLYGS